MIIDLGILFHIVRSLRFLAACKRYLDNSIRYYDIVVYLLGQQLDVYCIAF